MSQGNASGQYTGDKITILKSSFLFSGSKPKELEQLAKLTVERHFGRGEFIFLEGDAPEWLYIVSEGRVKILKQSLSGKEVIIAVFGKGEVFGEVAVFDGKPYPASAQAMDKAAVLGVRRQELLSFISHNPQVALKIIGTLGERLKIAHERLRDLATEKVEQRLGRIVLMLCAKVGITLPFTRQELADMAGTTTETVIRLISRWQKRGIIKGARGKIVISDIEKLNLLIQ